MSIFNMFLRIVSSWVLYWDWGDRRGLVPVTVTKNMETGGGGSVRSGSVLTHYPGNLIYHKANIYIKHIEYVV